MHSAWLKWHTFADRHIANFDTASVRNQVCEGTRFGADSLPPKGCWLYRKCSFTGPASLEGVHGPTLLYECNVSPLQGPPFFNGPIIAIKSDLDLIPGVDPADATFLLIDTHIRRTHTFHKPVLFGTETWLHRCSIEGSMSSLVGEAVVSDDEHTRVKPMEGHQLYFMKEYGDAPSWVHRIRYSIVSGVPTFEAVRASQENFRWIEVLTDLARCCQSSISAHRRIPDEDNVLYLRGLQEHVRIFVARNDGALISVACGSIVWPWIERAMGLPSGTIQVPRSKV